MSTKQFEFYHGVVLTRLVRSDRPVRLQMSVNQPADSWSAYLIDDSVALFIKRSGKPTELKKDKTLRWQFTFSDNQLIQMMDYSKDRAVYLALVASRNNSFLDGVNICLISPEQLNSLVDWNTKGTESFTLKDAESSHSYLVCGNGIEIRVKKKAFDSWDIPTTSKTLELRASPSKTFPKPKSPSSDKPLISLNPTQAKNDATPSTSTGRISNPYRPSGKYHLIFELLNGNCPFTKKELIHEVSLRTGMPSQTVSHSVQVITSPREHDGRGNRRGSSSAMGHLYFVTTDSNNKLHVFPRNPPMQSLKKEKRDN
jgi:hypothetical protein